MIATVHDERPIQDKPDLSMRFDPNRNIPLFKLHYRQKSLVPISRVAKTTHAAVSGTNCRSGDLTRMILLQALAYAEEVGASSNILTEPQLNKIDQIPGRQHSTNDLEGRRRRLSSPTIIVPSRRNQGATVEEENLSRSEHGTSSSVVTTTSRTNRRGSLGSSSGNNIGLGSNSSPRVSPLIRKTRNAEWVVVDSSSRSGDKEMSGSSSRVRAAFALMQESSLPSPKVIRIAALDAAASSSTWNKNDMGEQLPLYNTATASPSCSSGMHSKAMEAAALKKQHGSSSKNTKSKSTTGIQQQQRQRRILQRSQSLGNRPSNFATPTPSRLLQRSQSLGTSRLSLPMPGLLETIDESNEGGVC